MIFGDKSKFAIQVDVLDFVDDWVFGAFLFWIRGELVGNPEDKSVDLKGCLNWMKKFSSSTVDRFEPQLFKMDKHQAYIQLCDSVIVRDHQNAFFAKERYSCSFERFHISHLGMSSFDEANILLIEDKNAGQRFIWQQNDQPVKEAFLNPGEVQRVIEETILEMEDKVSKC